MGYVRSKASLSPEAFHRLGIATPGLLFDDGFHALFPTLGDGDDAGPLLGEYHELNRARARVLAALRRYCRANQVALCQRADGRWSYQLEGLIEGQVCVGATLTRALQEGSPESALLELLASTILGSPDLDGARALLEDSGPIEDLPWRDEESAVSIFGPSILGWDWSSPQGPRRRPSGPGDLLLEAFLDRVGRHRFSVDLSEPEVALIEFTDKLDCYRFRPADYNTDRRLDQREQVLEGLIHEFMELDGKRARALVEIERRTSGLFLDHAWESYFFGTTHRQYEFPVGARLTERLRACSPDLVVKQWLEEQGLEACHGPTPLRRSLPVLPGAEPLSGWRDLGDEVREVLAKTKAMVASDPAAPLHDHESPCSLWLRHPWHGECEVDWWREVASRAWLSGDNDAALVAMRLGDRKPVETLLEERLSRWEPYHHECYNDELLWFLAEDLTFAFSEEELSARYPIGLGEPPAPLGFLQAMSLRDARDAEGLVMAAASVHPAAARAWLSHEELARLHAACLEVARQPRVELATDLLTVACHYQWPDITGALVANETFITSQLEQDMPQPGYTALLLVAAGAPQLASRFAVHAFDHNLPLESVSDPELRAMLLERLRQMGEMDRLAAAIAWTRVNVAYSEATSSSSLPSGS